jgi:hypothetical protein
MNVTIIGAYLPRLSPERLAKYVSDDRAHYLAHSIPHLRSQGFLTGLSDEDASERAAEIAEETQHALEHAALFEAEVVESDGTFDAGFIEAAWEPTYLSPDGATLLEDINLSPATAETFRVAFYVHDWQDGHVLVGPGGPFLLPAFTPVPERLWQLAPYALVD